MQRDLAFSHYRAAAAAAAALVLSSFFPLIPPRALLNCMRLVASLFFKSSFFFCVGLVLGRSHRDLFSDFEVVCFWYLLELQYTYIHAHGLH